MDDGPLDEFDRGILHLLQQDARHRTPIDMAERLPVSDGTVRNRIGSMEERGIIQGYVPILDYEAAGFPLKVSFSCTVPISRRTEIANELLGISHVVNVREYMTGRENLRITVIATGTDDITRVGTEMDERGIDIEREELIRHEYVQPFDHFGEDIVEEEEKAEE